jgi:hypothetical protein
LSRGSFGRLMAQEYAKRLNWKKLRIFTLY